jgi:hypothetical protein
MHEANDDHVLDDRLQELVDAEADKKAGKSPSDPTLASMSLDQLQREIRTVSRALAKAWGEDAAEGDALANALREEARLAAPLNKPKNYVVSRDVEIKGDLHRQAWGAWGAAGFFHLLPTGKRSISFANERRQWNLPFHSNRSGNCWSSLFKASRLTNCVTQNTYLVCLMVIWSYSPLHNVRVIHLFCKVGGLMLLAALQSTRSTAHIKTC